MYIYSCTVLVLTIASYHQLVDFPIDNAYDLWVSSNVFDNFGYDFQ